MKLSCCGIQILGGVTQLPETWQFRIPLNNWVQFQLKVNCPSNKLDVSEGTHFLGSLDVVFTL